MSLDAIFKAYDIRGLVPDELNEAVATRIGRAFAEFLTDKSPETNSQPLIVGHDMRSDSKALAQAVITGIKTQGRDVISVGLVASDMLYFAVGHLRAAGGVVVTASHNPGKYNGMKICREEARPVGVDTGLLDIKRAVELGEFPQCSPGTIAEANIMKAWVEHALSFTGELKPFRVAVDAGNGMAGAVIPHLIGKTPLEITPLYFELDGTFPNHEANPLKEETLEVLKRTVVENGLDLGLAFDGDGDRVVLIDETGQTVSGSVTAAILAEHFLDEHPGSTILYNAICSRVVDQTIRENGGIPVRTKVGHSYIKAAMREYDAPFGGEHSAHYYFRDNWSADSGLIAALVAMSVLSEAGGSLSELANRFRTSYVQSGEINFEVADKETVIARIKTAFNDGEQDELDGLSVNYKDKWFNVRASNTEPLLRLNIEARDQDQVDELVGRLTSLIGQDS
ncbi:MAG: hypothetical protein WD467_01880 [Candidatus Saccharimonadales bacterium]